MLEFPVLRLYRKNLKSYDSILWDVISIVSGVVYTLAFAPFNISYAVFPALACLFLTSLSLCPKRAALRGYCFGLGQFGLGVSWVYVSVHDYGGGGLFGSLLITSLFVGFWALFPAIAVYLATALSYKQYKRLILFPLLWGLVEYLRGRIVLKGFPWLQTAYSQLDTPLAGYIPLVGGYGTGLLAALSAAMLIRLLIKPKSSQWLLVCVVSIWIAGAFSRTVAWTQPIGDPIKTTLIQGNISQDKKWLPETRGRTILQYIQMTQAHWDSKIIVWPESSVPAYLSDVYDSFLAPLSRIAKAHQTDLIISVPSFGNAEGEKYNSAITLGREEEMYRKVHLLPFGEYMPWQPVSGWILAHFNLRLSSFTPGSPDQPLLSAGGYRFITSICYEDAFTENALRGLPEAAYLVNATNDAWFGNSIEPHQHLQIARMRALETGRYLLRSTNTGVTAIISPEGQVVNQAPLFSTTTLTGMILPMAGLTPYARIGGDTPIVIFMLALLLIVMIQGNAQTVRECFFKSRSY
ncbi:apolipoprotein N-acyltransferase [Methylomicrobium sp. Wu6]|uniref:apolipoprotein N-acyltransferase n=1 Tax=Methylomicrobium sp. Wu6 TaxID=3107928 RepID=UPI002DD619A4|nr:apolipoprotein N-acyltransferase [Methylomicrobium sp. Wu6]MEC4747748.1 apolipoprotein N-acyltransferase [Methylomicrobium sp. Wu6]